MLYPAPSAVMTATWVSLGRGRSICRRLRIPGFDPVHFFRTIDQLGRAHSRIGLKATSSCPTTATGPDATM